MISLMDWGNRVDDVDQVGYVATLYADTRAEIEAAGKDVKVANIGTIHCMPGSSCITKLGEVLLLSGSGTWGVI